MKNEKKAKSGRAGGAVSSEKKSRAARSNGKKGGRPAKFLSAEERYRHHNNVRRGRVCDCSFCKS